MGNDNDRPQHAPVVSTRPRWPVFAAAGIVVVVLAGILAQALTDTSDPSPLSPTTERPSVDFVDRGRVLLVGGPDGVPQPRWSFDNGGGCAGAVALQAVLTGDVVVTAAATGPDQTSPHVSVTASTVDDGTIRWNADLGAGTPTALVDLEANRLLVSTVEHLWLLEAASGTVLAERPLDGASWVLAGSSIALAPGTRGDVVVVSFDLEERFRIPARGVAAVEARGGVVAVADQSGVRAVALDDGAELWSVPIGAVDGLRLLDAAVVARVGDGTIRGLDLATGSERWSIAESGTLRSFGGDLAAIFSVAGTVVINADGVEQWRDPSDRVLAVTGDGPEVAFRLARGTLQLLDPASGSVVADLPGVPGLAVTTNHLYGVSQDGVQVYSLDDGALAFAIEAPGACAVKALEGGLLVATEKSVTFHR